MAESEPGKVEAPVVGVIGLGDIGDGVSKSLLAAGLPLVVCDLRSEALDPYRERATVADSPADLARRSDVVIVAVVNDAQVHAVLSGPDGALAAAGPGTTCLIFSTITTSCIEAIGIEAEKAGVEVVDCGVSGGPSAAAEGELVCMAGGDEAAVARLAPVFDAVSSLVVRMGPFGAGLTAKLARNLVTYGAWLAAYEATTLAEAAGIELAKLAQVIRASEPRIGGTATLMFRTTAGPMTESDDPGLIRAMRNGATLAHKDLQAAMAVAATLGVDLPLAVMADARTDDVFGVGPDTPGGDGATGTVVK